MLLFKHEEIETSAYESFTAFYNVCKNQPIFCQPGFEHYIRDHVLISKFPAI